MSRRLPMPEVATGVSEAVVVQWFVPPGQAFAKGDALALVETDKASVDVSAEEDGVLLAHLAALGATVRVGDDLALIGENHHSEHEPPVDAPAGQAAEPDGAAHREVPPAPAAAAPPAPDFEAIPHSRMRRAIARVLVESTNTVPHFYLRARLKVVNAGRNVQRGAG